MEKIIKQNGKIYLVTSNDGYWRHINKKTIGTYEIEEPIEMTKNRRKKKETIVENEKSED